MNYIFLDYENVGIEGLRGIERFDEYTRIFFFYSKGTASVPIDLFVKTGESKVKFAYFETQKGNNALDFVLSSYLGYAIGKHKDYFSSGMSGVDLGESRFINSNPKNTTDFFYIVSKDRGYEPLIKFWDREDLKISIVKSLTEIKSFVVKPAKRCKIIEEAVDVAVKNAEKKVNAVKKEIKTKKNIRSLIGMKIKGISKTNITKIVNIINNNSKASINNALTKTFKEKGKEYYKAIKPILKDIGK